MQIFMALSISFAFFHDMHHVLLLNTSATYAVRWAH